MSCEPVESTCTSEYVFDVFLCFGAGEWIFFLVIIFGLIIVPRLIGDGTPKTEEGALGASSEGEV